MTGGPRAPRGARSLVLAQCSKAVTLFLGIVILSRLLTPEEFGFVAVPLAIVGVGEILRDMGLSTAATTTPDLSKSLRDLLFWLNCVIAIVLAFLTILIAPWISSLFDSPQVGTVLPWLSLVFILNGVGAQYRADLNRSMRFSAMAIVDSVAPVVGVCVAIFSAAVGFGYWALVLQPIASAVVSTAALVALSGSVPGLPRRVEGARSVITFGAHIAGSQSLIYIGNNIDIFALGLWVSPTQLGYYSRAFQVAVQPLTLLKAPATSVALPLLSRRVEDSPGFVRAVGLGQKVLAYTIFPAALVVAGASTPVVLVFLGEDWRPTIQLVAVLAIAASIQQLASISSWILLATGKGRSLSTYSAVSLGIKAAAILLAAPYGTLAVACAYLLAAVLSAPTAYIWACRATQLPTRVLARELVAPASVAMLSAAGAYIAARLLTASAPLLQLAGSLAGVALVYALAAATPPVRRDIKQVAAILLRRSR
ncbi:MULTISPECIES: lipopolysaccharide biosynthesis protein [Microbacterium]|uniref:lipopolysaccharide biosynthesis protein n=1 Tax=Microbacterium TaxID=33882 RepID=UPI000D649B56|nr:MULTISPECIES: lipopolysaccharide biosynthesis protein [Microbacterium]